MLEQVDGIVSREAWSISKAENFMDSLIKTFLYSVN